MGAVTEDVLHSRYLAHVKRESRSYVNQVSKEEEHGEQLQPKEEVEEEGKEDEQELAEKEGEEERRQGEQWTVEMREELWQEKIHVEEKLRCIQDEHFYELLQVGWSSETDPDPLSFICMRHVYSTPLTSSIYRSDGWKNDLEAKKLQNP